jgi:hypothetical protein
MAAAFRLRSGRYATCAALPIDRAIYAAPRRGKKVSVEMPCGRPPDLDTSRLVACAEAVTEAPPPDAAALRDTCRRGL